MALNDLFGNLFKSKEQRALEAKLALRRSVQELKKCDKNLEKKKAEMLAHAQEAKKQGAIQQYQMAVAGLKMLMRNQQRSRAMVLQIQMAESMRDLTAMSTDFVRTLGNVGKELGDLVKETNFAQNQLDFEKGMLQFDGVMSQLEDFLEDTGMSLEDLSDDELTKEVEQLIDATAAASPDPVDDEIERRLAELQKKKAAIKE